MTKRTAMRMPRASSGGVMQPSGIMCILRFKNKKSCFLSIAPQILQGDRTTQQRSHLVKVEKTLPSTLELKNGQKSSTDPVHGGE